MAPTVIFIDEIESLAPRRGGGLGGPVPEMEREYERIVLNLRQGSARAQRRIGFMVDGE